MSGFQFVDEPVTAIRNYGTVDRVTAQTWTEGDPLVWLASGLLDSASIDDNSIWLIADLPAGFALDPAIKRAGSRPADSATLNLKAGFDGNDIRTFVPTEAVAGGGVIMQTPNFWSAGAPGTQVPAGPALTDIGTPFEITAVAPAAGVPAIWGVEQDAGVPGTDVCAIVVNVLNADSLPLSVFGGTGTFVNFIVQLHA